MKLTKLRLTLDVDFNAATVNTPVLRGYLEQLVMDAVSNGTLTGDSPATVERYNFTVTERRSVKKPVKSNTIIGRQYGTWALANRAINQWLKRHPEVKRTRQNNYWGNKLDEGCIEIEATSQEIAEFGHVELGTNTRYTYIPPTK